MAEQAEPAPGTRQGGGAAGERRPFDTNVAHSARVHDYWLGGKDNYAADRAGGDSSLRGEAHHGGWRDS